MVVVVGVLAAVLVPPYKLGSSSCAAFYGAALVTAPCYLLHVMPCRCAASCRCAQARTLRVPVPASLLACCRSHCSTHLVLPFTPYCHCDVLLQAVATNQVLVTVAMTMYKPLCRFCFPSPQAAAASGKGAAGLPPHVYGVACAAYRQMMRDRAGQAILVSRGPRKAGDSRG